MNNIHRQPLTEKHRIRRQVVNWHNVYMNLCTCDDYVWQLWLMQCVFPFQSSLINPQKIVSYRYLALFPCLLMIGCYNKANLLIIMRACCNGICNGLHCVCLCTENNGSSLPLIRTLCKISLFCDVCFSTTQCFKSIYFVFFVSQVCRFISNCFTYYFFN